METISLNEVEVLHLKLEEQGIQVSASRDIVSSFLDFFGQVQGWQKQASSIKITSVAQKSEMKIAREARLALKNVRVEVEHTRKRLKEESLRTGQTIDAIAKILTNEIVPIERYLEEQEKFVEIQEKKRKVELRAAREVALAPFSVETQHYNLEQMSDEAFDSLLHSSKLAFEEKQAALALAEAERVAREKAEAEAREAQRLENERLKAEAEQLRKEKAESEAIARAEAERLQKEKAEVEAIARQERLERERLEQEARVKAEAEAIAEKEAEQQRLQAEAAEKARPDREKLLTFASEIKTLATKEIGIEHPEYAAMLQQYQIALNTLAESITEKLNM